MTEKDPWPNSTRNRLVVERPDSDSPKESYVSISLKHCEVVEVVPYEAESVRNGLRRVRVKLPDWRFVIELADRVNDQACNVERRLSRLVYELLWALVRLTVQEADLVALIHFVAERRVLLPERVRDVAERSLRVGDLRYSVNDQLVVLPVGLAPQAGHCLLDGPQRRNVHRDASVPGPRQADSPSQELCFSWLYALSDKSPFDPIQGPDHNGVVLRIRHGHSVLSGQRH